VGVPAGRGDARSAEIASGTSPKSLLNAYFARIGYSGPADASLATLEALHALHPAAIAFENLDPLMGRLPGLEPGALSAKLLADRRGGYCYEHNTLFLTVLRALGMAARSVAARVLWGLPADFTMPRIHMLLHVRLPEGDHIADVGFGRLTLNAPLRLEPHLEQTTSHGVYRLVPRGDEFQMQAMLDGTWRGLYQLSLQDEFAVDWEVANWYSATNPHSIFTRSLMVTRSLGDARYALLDDRFRIYRADGTVAQRVMTTPAELRVLLENEFAIALPQDCESVLVRCAGGNGGRHQIRETGRDGGPT
jgi:N-hydroxyarylamine O-acetyltransferase